MVCLDVLGDRLGDVEHPLDLLGAAGDVGVERQRPVDLDDVDRDQLGLGRAGLLGDEPDDAGVARAAVEGEDGAAEGGGVVICHGRRSRYHRRRRLPVGARRRSSRRRRTARDPHADTGPSTTTVCGRPSSTVRSRFAAWL